MKTDISKLSASDLDELIFEAAKRRASMQPQMPGERPQTVQAVMNPAWFVTPVNEGALIQIGHPGFGWLAFIIPPTERVQLLSLFLTQSLLANQTSVVPETTAPSAPVSGSGGKLH